MVLNKKIKRDYFVEDNQVWARFFEEFKNGDNKTIRRTICEEMSKEDVAKILSEHIPKQIIDNDNKHKDTIKGIKDTEHRIKNVVNTREYLEFKKYLESDEFKKMSGVYNLEKNKLPIEDILSIDGYQELYNKFKSINNDKKYKDYYITFRDEKNLNDLKKQLEQLNSNKHELVLLNTQMREIEQYFKTNG